MPYIPQVKVGTQTYSVKDSEAREQISDLKSALSNYIYYHNLVNDSEYGEGYPIIVDGKITGYGTQQYWRRRIYNNVIADTIYRFDFTRSANNDVYHVYYLDNENTIVEQLERGSQEQQITVEHMVPNGVSKIVLLSYYGTPIIYEKKVIYKDYDIYPGPNEISFQGNKTTEDPLVINIGRMFVRVYESNSDAYLSLNIQNQFNLNHADALCYDKKNRILLVKRLNKTIGSEYEVLLWKQLTDIKGIWKTYYFKDQSQKAFVNIKLLGVMSRQGEGFGYPDNSILAVKESLKNGYNKIRISVASTSDNVLYCTHSYELQNNSTTNCLKLDGNLYNDNVEINNKESSFINRLSYKDYPIPTLEDMLKMLSLYNVEVTIELKDTITEENAAKLLELIKYYKAKCIISGLEEQIQFFLDKDMNLAIIMHFNETYARQLIQSYKTSQNRCKSLRFDCWYDDTITKNNIIDLIHPDYKIKLGGGIPTDLLLKNSLSWADVCEYSGPLPILI